MLPAEVFSANAFTSLHVQSVSRNVDLKDLEMTDLSSLGPCSMESVSGDLHLPDITCARLVVSSVSGNIAGGSAAAETAEVKSTSGDIQFSGITGCISMRTVSGNISVTIAEISDRIELQSISGDIELDIPQESSISMMFSTVSGDFSSEIPIETSQSQKNTLTGLLGSGEFPVQIESTSGNLRLF